MPCCECGGESWGYDFCSGYCACNFYMGRKEVKQPDPEPVETEGIIDYPDDDWRDCVNNEF